MPVKNDYQKKIKILIICQHFWPESFRVTDLCEGLVDQGYQVDVLCGIPNYPSGNFFQGYGLFSNRRQKRNGVNIIRVPEIPRGNDTNFRILINYLSFPLFALFYVPMLAFRKYDRILVYQLSPVFMAMPGILISKLSRAKLYVYICDFWPHSLFSVLRIRNSLLRKILTRVSYWHYKQADGLIAVFKGIQDRLIKDVGIKPDKTIYIPQAAEKIYEKPIIDEKLQKKFRKGFNIVFAGSINPAQSFNTVIRAASIVRSRGFTDVNYIIVGDGMSRKWLEDAAKRARLDDAFYFEGFKPVEEIPKYQTVADVLLVALSKSPLFEYGIPAKVQSYMASGKPIVAAMDGEGRRLINKSGCGLCVGSGDAEGLAKAIISLVEMSPTKRSKMGDLGRKYHFKHFERNYNLNRLKEFVFNNKIIPDNEY